MDYSLEFDAATGCHLFRGELGIYTASSVYAAWMSLLRTDGPHSIDLAGVTEIDVAGLQLILLAKRRAGSSVRFCNASEPVRDAVRLIHLEGLLEQSAVASL